MAIKKHWSIPNGDSPIVVYGVAMLVLILWCLTIGAFELEYKLQMDPNTYKIGGWWNKIFKRKPKNGISASLD